MRKSLLLLVAVALVSCGLPRDPHKTLVHARGRTLTIGISEDPPYVVRHGEEATGLEADVIRGFARRLGARIEWKWGAQEKQLDDLHHFQLDLVGGGLTADTPWKSKVAVTRPFAELAGKQHVLAVPPGENAFLLELETYLAAQKDAVEAAAGKSK